MPDQTTRRIERLEQQAAARGTRIDASWLLGVVSEVYGEPLETEAFTMRDDTYDEYCRVMLMVYGA